MRAAVKYPIYIPSKSRSEVCLTADLLQAERVPFYLVVEPQERESYAKRYPAANILVVPDDTAGRGAVPIRNWIWEHSLKRGDARHWQLDDNIDKVLRIWKGRRIICAAAPAFQVAEVFTERYENIGLTGLNYVEFVGVHPRHEKPFYLNAHVYSCILIDNSMPHRWRGPYNADTDLCLQVLSSGLCTVLINAFVVDKKRTMTISGGNTPAYSQLDGRLKMSRCLERRWPGVVSTTRRFKRPQHIVKDSWRRFDTELKLRADISLDALPKIDDFGLTLEPVREIKNTRLRQLYAEHQQAQEHR